MLAPSVHAAYGGNMRETLRPKNPRQLLPHITLHANKTGLLERIETVCARRVTSYFVATTPVGAEDTGVVAKNLRYFTLDRPIQTPHRRIANIGGVIDLRSILQYDHGIDGYCAVATLQLHPDETDLSNVVRKQTVPIPCLLEDMDCISLDARATQRAVARMVFDTAYGVATPDTFEMLDGLLYYQLAAPSLPEARLN